MWSNNTALFLVEMAILTIFIVLAVHAYYAKGRTNMVLFGVLLTSSCLFEWLRFIAEDEQNLWYASCMVNFYSFCNYFNR